MADRLERVKAHVLNWIADDYEEIGQIMIDLHRWNSELEITREEVKVALAALVQDGLAKTYDLHSSQVPLLGLPDAATFEAHYFYITPKGKEKLLTLPEEWFPQIAGD
jgi:hypothetical protein